MHRRTSSEEIKPALARGRKPASRGTEQWSERVRQVPLRQGLQRLGFPRLNVLSQAMRLTGTWRTVRLIAGILTPTAGRVPRQSP